MKEYTYKNIKGRNELIDKLVEEYWSSTAPEATIILGNHGCGKTYVIYETINKLLLRNNSGRKPQIYIAEDDKLVLQHSSKNISLDNLNVGISLPMRWGIGVDVTTTFSSNNSSNEFNHICSMLKNHMTTDILICLPKYSKQNRKIKLLVSLLTSNLIRLKKTFKHNIFFLLSDNEESCIEDFIICQTSQKIHLEDYEEDDIFHYLVSKHGILLEKNKVREKLEQIKKICASNLKLVDFLYVDFVEQNVDFFRALDSVVTYRLGLLKREGKERNVSEYDMEDIILTSSINLKNFGYQEIAAVTHKQTDAVRESLHLASKQILLKKDEFNFYNFTCNEIRVVLQKELCEKRRERYLDYYNYYTEQEQDQYYFRAYYLWSYTSRMRDEIFALLILAYSEALNFKDMAQIHNIDKIFKSDASHFYEDYKKIALFYKMLGQNSITFSEIETAYADLQRDYYELPLKAELARAFFHFMYKHYAPWNLLIKTTLSQLIQYSQEQLCLETSKYPIEITKIDESIIRLRIIYDISPFILDTQNNSKLFKELYALSVQLNENIHSTNLNNGIAQYMEMVFCRKAFLFVNQTQCNIYYDKAKKYFYNHEIWDEYCITLVCEAGTDIVIQKYKEAICCCRKALKVSQDKSIVIPYLQKLKNNLIISNFLLYEQTHSNKQCIAYAQRTAKKLRKYLNKIPCASEFVIVTNICSLYLYTGNIPQYSFYKKYIERLMDCPDVADLSDEDVDDFYRYYFAWFEIYRYIINKSWKCAEQLTEKLDGFVPTLFQKQEVFWDKKIIALKQIIRDKNIMDGYDFCKKLVPLNRKASELATFFCRGLMLSDLQYTSYD